MSKNIIITGTSSGIGFELVKIFSKDNNRVLALSRNNSKLRDLKLDGVDAIDFDINNPDDLFKIIIKQSKNFRSLKITYI